LEGLITPLQPQSPDLGALTHLGKLAAGTFWAVALLVIFFQVLFLVKSYRLHFNKVSKSRTRLV